MIDIPAGGIDFSNNVNAYQLIEDTYHVFSIKLERWFTGPTLTIARANRSEAERVAREHHAKNVND